MGGPAVIGLLSVAFVGLGVAVAAPGDQPKGPGKPSASRPAKAAASAPASAPASRPAGPPRIEFEIGLGDQNWGKIVLELNEEKAPITVKNFVRYVDEGFLDGTIFHRVMPNFMIQSGGFFGLGEQKTEGLHDPIQNEAKNGLKNRVGTIAMARTNQPHSATSQFFINVKDNDMLDYPSFDQWGYCVFGQVVEGMDVVDRIKNVPTRPSRLNPREKSEPIDPPVLKKARRVGAGATGAKRRVLIICSSNTGRSQLAEGLWRRLGGDQWDVFSAGIAPGEAVSPLAIKVMIELGIDIRSQKTKSIEQFVSQPFDLVVTVCGEADKKCPVFPNAKRRLHWPIDNPSGVTGSDEDKLKAYRTARDQIKARIVEELAKSRK